MTTGFVNVGPVRFETSESFQAQCRELRAQVRLQFSAQLASAGFFRRLMIRYQMHRAFQRAVADISPSSQALWLAETNVINKRKLPTEKCGSKTSDCTRGSV